MLIITIHAVFAFIFGTFARHSLPRGWYFTRSGWLTLHAHADDPDATTNVEQRRLLTAGSQFLIAGLGWLLAGVASSIACLVVIVMAIQALGII